MHEFISDSLRGIVSSWQQLVLQEVLTGIRPWLTRKTVFCLIPSTLYWFQECPLSTSYNHTWLIFADGVELVHTGQEWSLLTSRAVGDSNVICCIGSIGWTRVAMIQPAISQVLRRSGQTLHKRDTRGNCISRWMGCGEKKRVNTAQWSVWVLGIQGVFSTHGATRSVGRVRGQ